jgi:hypothetical protein
LLKIVLVIFCEIWCAPRFNFGPLFFFLIYINDITKVSINGTHIFLYSNDTNIIVTDPKYIDYKLTMTRTFDEVSTWFRINLLKLNINKTHILQFNSMNYENCGMHNNIGQNFQANSVCIKFLGLNIGNGLTWRNDIDYLVTKLSSSCFIMGTIKSRIGV